MGEEQSQTDLGGSGFEIINIIPQLLSFNFLFFNLRERSLGNLNSLRSRLQPIKQNPVLFPVQQFLYSLVHNPGQHLLQTTNHFSLFGAAFHGRSWGNGEEGWPGEEFRAGGWREGGFVSDRDWVLWVSIVVDQRGLDCGGCHGLGRKKILGAGKD